MIEWIDVKSDSSYVSIKLIPLSSHLWSITNAEFLWDDISSLILSSSIISSFILTLDSVSVPFYKMMSVLNRLSFLMFIQGWFEFTITLPLFDVFTLFHLLLFTCELTVLNILLLDLEKHLCHVLFLTM